MQEITISDEIINGIKNRSKHLNCSPEKLVNSILYDYLMKVEDVSSVDVEKLEKSALHIVHHVVNYKSCREERQKTNK